MREWKMENQEKKIKSIPSSKNNKAIEIGEMRKEQEREREREERQGLPTRWSVLLYEE